MESTVHKVGFLGIGKMGSAIAKGLSVSDEHIKIYAYDPIASLQDDLAGRVAKVNSSAELEELADTLIICVKPQEIKSALKGLKGNKRYISIAAGVPLASIQKELNCKSNRLSRVMPNICVTVGKGVSGYYTEDDELKRVTEHIFSAVGSLLFVKSEELLHAVTGLSGSGPAFVFSFIDALAEGGVYCGLTYADSLELAVQTLTGSCTLLLESKEHPSVWKNRVCSPKGTTIEGLKAMERGGFHNSVMDGVIAATEKSRELAKE